VTETATARVTPEEAGVRLDRWLADKLPMLGRRQAKAWCATGRVTVDGRAANKDLRLKPGMEIRYELAPERAATQNAELPLDVRLETNSFVIVNKPAGQPSVALSADDRDTLTNALLARYPEMQQMEGNPLEAGLVHRLDTGTSGLLLAARTTAAFRTLQQALRAGRLRKQYVAIVCAGPLQDRGCIDTPLRPSPRNSRRMVTARVDQKGARRAKTEYEVVERNEHAAVTLASAGPALRHQIRAHFASIGCPLLNDEQYGAPRDSRLAASRHALHARRIAWDGDGNLPPFDCIEPLPEDLLAVLRAVGMRLSLEL
jgi:23S rRNA pseudouridine1911/1915/1917 synthase